MKAINLALAASLLLPSGFALANEANPSSPIEVCKAKAQFQYHFDMMQIEKEEITDRIPHSKAESKKMRRHMQFLGELKECEEIEEK